MNLITLTTSSPFFGWNYKITIKKNKLSKYFKNGVIENTYILKNISPALNGVFTIVNN